MQIKLLHHTPHIHKLIEITARECYQSFNKLSPTSHTMLKGIMAKGHLSTASVGNLVFSVILDHEDEDLLVLDCLSAFKQINNFIRWTDRHHKQNGHSRYDYVISMNVLSLLDVFNGIDNYLIEKELFDLIIEQVKQRPELYWFIDSSTEVEPMDNPYKLTADLGEPIILTEDYTALKDKLTDFELDIHATITANIVFDRATSLQIWRHGDQTGGTELSQRYVDLTNARYRVPSDLDGELLEVYELFMQAEIDAYDHMKEKLRDLGKKRSQEIARNLLPNVLTNVIQTRPLRQWKHLIKLRNTPHAQKEVMEDTRALISKFVEFNIPVQ